MKARTEMMIAIRETVAAWGLTQAAMAKRLGLTQPRLDDLLRRRINKFSLDALINVATAAGLAGAGGSGKGGARRPFVLILKDGSRARRPLRDAPWGRSSG
jgi:predicted XRE-type DNA-binding protein